MEKVVRFYFHLASSAKLTIKVYSIAGELVRSLVRDKAYLPRAYEELWKEDNDRRGGASSGSIHIYNSGRQSCQSDK